MCAEPNTKPRRQFPTAFTILFLIMLLAIALTWIIPAGAYSKLSYNPANDTLMVNSPKGRCFPNQPSSHNCPSPK
ncbi:hypothetical protein [Aeromonas salmonicida]|uniref:hypothetical protein n=1 Tax=Aeromonas salmonicida TaxID=645 RepID=UPI0038CF4427